MESKTIVTKNGNEYTFYGTKSDINGNPRYLVSWIALGLPNYKATDLTRKAGLSIYRGKSFGGGFVFSSYSLRHEAEILESLGLYRKPFQLENV